MLHESSRQGVETAVNVFGSPEAKRSSGVEEQSAGGDAAKKRRCALCGKHYLVTDSRLAPFCSERCQQVDLGNWLGEAYGLPWEDPAGGESLPGAADDD